MIGLTSPANLTFAEGLGCYDQAVCYDDLVSLPASIPTVFVCSSRRGGVSSCPSG